MTSNPLVPWLLTQRGPGVLSGEGGLCGVQQPRTPGFGIGQTFLASIRRSPEIGWNSGKFDSVASFIQLHTTYMCQALCWTEGYSSEKTDVSPSQLKLILYLFF